MSRAHESRGRERTANPGAERRADYGIPLGTGSGTGGETGTRTDAPPVQARSLGLWERLLEARDRILASPRFQRWAASFPLTRPIALRRSRQVFDLCAGFVYSQSVLACVRLDLFDLLSEGPLSVRELATETGIPEERLARLLGAGEALRLLRRTRDGRIALGPLGAPLVGNEALAAMVEHNVLFYHDLSDPLQLLRNGSGASSSLLQRYWAYTRSPQASELTEDQVGPYSSLMAQSQPLVSREILDAYPFDEHRVVLDVGGGEGAFLEAVGREHPELSLALFDLPAVSELGRRRLESAFPDRDIRVRGGDFFRDRLPRGADLITLVRILHDHNDAEALRILQSAREALEPGGRVVVAEPMAGVRGAETVGDAYFSLYLLAMGQGRPRTPSEYRDLLRAAGFRRIRTPRPRSPVLTGMVSGQL
ncbi:MAG: methyltransferase domain-containing protein [Gemmatimonadales bacterium]|nr:MAG: methyltransferase domain-containing protein [Gemmatimonadales bacterium]